MRPASRLNQTWTQTLNDANNPIVDSSPNVADLDGQPSVVVGDRAGGVYAYHLSNGSGVGGWPYNAGAAGRLLPVGGADRQRARHGLRRVGQRVRPTAGGYQAIAPNGGDQWFDQETNPGTDPTPQRP